MLRGEEEDDKRRTFKKYWRYKKIYKEENVKKVISYYLVNELRFKRRFPEKLKKITEDKAYIKVMTEFIEKYDIRTQQAKDFLSKNGKYDLLAKFNRR